MTCLRALSAFTLGQFFLAGLAQATSPADFEVDSSDSSLVRFIGPKQAVITTDLVFQRCAFGMTWQPSSASCTGVATVFNTIAQAQAAVDQLNQQLSLTTTQTQWHIANINELRLMVPTPPVSQPAIFPVFPNTPADVFWSSTKLYAAKDNPLGNFTLDFATGKEAASDHAGKYIRLVRGYQPTLGFDFQVHPTDPSVIIDVGSVNTGLLFQRCSMGMTWDDTQKTCTGTATLYKQSADATAEIDAINLAAGLSTAKWRLPSHGELGPLKPPAGFMPTSKPYIYPIFPNTPAAKFFTSPGIFPIDFSHSGGTTLELLPKDSYIRLVRAGPDVIKLSAVAGSNGTVESRDVETIAPGFMRFRAIPDLGFKVDAYVGDNCHVVPTLTPLEYQILAAPKTCIATITFAQDPLFVPVTTYTGTTQPSTGMGSTATASFTGGGPRCSFDTRGNDTQFIPAPAVLPANASLPQGMFQFKLSGCDSTPVRMTITWPEDVQALSKYGLEQAGATTRSYFTPDALTIRRKVTAFTITDGQKGDDDWQQNGEIIDPVGPLSITASAVSPIPVPGPSAWQAMLFGTSVFALFAIFGLRRKRSAMQH